MVRMFSGCPMLLGIASMLSALTAAEEVASMTMQLHRLPRHEVRPERYMRRLSTENDASQVVPLHLGLGTHYTWVYAGTPPQRASVIVDTGSMLMAFPCSGCNGCGNHTDQPFAADKSSTLVHVTCSHKSFFQCKECDATSNACGISQSYLEGSTWKASVIEDVVYLGGDSSFTDVAMRNNYGTRFQFGCQSAETGLFVTQVADGIMGLANTDNHIIAKLHRENKVSSNLFSLCFVEDGGTMSVGHPLEVAHRGEISYAKLISDRSTGHFYAVQIKDVRINGKSINATEEAYTRGHFIVDSGTTDSYLPQLLKTEFLALFKEAAGRDYQIGNSCKGYTKEDMASLPTIQLVMEAHGDENGEVVINVPPEQYLVREKGVFCGNLYLSENAGGVIGASLMMNRDVIFDNGNQRVGFVDADCAYQGNESSTAIQSGNMTTYISEGKELERGKVPTTGVPSVNGVAVSDSPAQAANTTSIVPTFVPTAEPIVETTSNFTPVSAPIDPSVKTPVEANIPTLSVSASGNDSAVPSTDEVGVPDTLAQNTDTTSVVPTPEPTAATITSTVAGPTAPMVEVTLNSTPVSAPIDPSVKTPVEANIPTLSVLASGNDSAVPSTDDAGVPDTLAQNTDTTSVVPTPEPTAAMVETTSNLTPVSAPLESIATDAAVTTATNIQALNASASDANSKIQTSSEDLTPTTQSSGSAATGDSNPKEKSSSTHPMVLTIVGAVLVVGFLVMMLISVSRRRRETGKDQSWSRVKGDDGDEDDDDEEEFGVIHNKKKKSMMKHQRLEQEDDIDDDEQQSSSDEEDEVFDRNSAHVEESKEDNRILERL